MEQRRGEADDQVYKPIRRGWCFGEAQFREELLAQVDAQLGENHFGQERQESVEQKALRMIDEELRKLSLSLEDLRLRRNGDPVKVGIARLLRRQTTMSLKWVAEQLGMESWKYLSKILSAESVNNVQLTIADGVEGAKSITTTKVDE